MAFDTLLSELQGITHEGTKRLLHAFVHDVKSCGGAVGLEITDDTGYGYAILLKPDGTYELRDNLDVDEMLYRNEMG